MKPSRICIVGAHPPVHGGIAIHVQQLALSLIERGLSVRVLDPYANPCSLPRPSYLTQLGPVRPSLLTALAFAINKFKPDVVHIHASRLGRIGYALPLLRILTNRTPIVLTVHGAFGDSFKSYGILQRVVTVVSLQCTSKIIAVSAKVADDVAEYGRLARHAISVLPAYMESGPPTCGTLPLGQRTLFAVAAGNGTRIYRFEDVIRAAEVSGVKGPIALFIYGNIDETYMKELEIEVACSSSTTIVYNAGRASFVEALGNARIFVRPTEQDGDSVAVREALAAGCSVFATDVAKRPDACSLFRPRDVDELARLMATSIREPGTLSAFGDGSCVDDYLGIYSAL